MKIKMFNNEQKANEWLQTNPIIRHIHTTEHYIIYHYEE